MDDQILNMETRPIVSDIWAARQRQAAPPPAIPLVISPCHQAHHSFFNVESGRVIL